MTVPPLPTFVENRLPVALRRARYFERALGVRPRLDDPQTFNEKMNHRILRDRRPLLAPLCDKLAMKDVARATGADVRIPRTYWSGTDLAEVAGREVGEEWVLKPNHGTMGRVVFGQGPLDPDALAPLTEGWLGENRHSRGLGEWAYSQARRLLVLEERIGSGRQAPTDYKVHVFHGKPAMVEVQEGRFDDDARRLGYYRPDWTQLPPQPGYRPIPEGEPPAQLATMLEVAADLAADYDFMRVDLYDVDGEIWFGEYTPYPGSGLVPFVPAELDHELGQLWELPGQGVRPVDAVGHRLGADEH